MQKPVSNISIAVEQLQNLAIYLYAKDVGEDSTKILWENLSSIRDAYFNDAISIAEFLGFKVAPQIKPVPKKAVKDTRRVVTNQPRNRLPQSTSTLTKSVSGRTNTQRINENQKRIDQKIQNRNKYLRSRLCELLNKHYKDMPLPDFIKNAITIPENEVGEDISVEKAAELVGMGSSPVYPRYFQGTSNWDLQDMIDQILANVNNKQPELV